MKVWIAQLKCPSNHAVLAVAGEYETEAEAACLKALVMGTFMAEVEAGRWRPECGLCKSRDLHVHIAPTIFPTLKEAMPAMRELERQQEMTRRVLQSGRN